MGWLSMVDRVQLSDKPVSLLQALLKAFIAWYILRIIRNYLAYRVRLFMCFPLVFCSRCLAPFHLCKKSDPILSRLDIITSHRFISSWSLFLKVVKSTSQSIFARIMNIP